MSLLRRTQYEAIRKQQDYYELVATGMAWVLFPNLQFDWEDFHAASILATKAKVRALRNRPNLQESLNASLIPT